jgi:hypothetical protein
MTSTLAYNTANELLSESFSGGTLAGLSVTNGYDQYLRRTQLAALNSGTPFLQHTFGYTNDSRLLTVTDNTVAGTPYSAMYSYLGGAAPGHRDPPQPVYRLRKIQCISQRTWNGLRVWLRQSLAKPEPARLLVPQGGRGAKGRARPRKTPSKRSKRVDSAVSLQVKPRLVK